LTTNQISKDLWHDGYIYWRKLYATMTRMETNLEIKDNSKQVRKARMREIARIGI
jgi:hypothetical protein